MRLVLAIVAGLLWLGSPAAADIGTLHHQLDLRLDPQKRTLEATDKIRMEGGGAVTFSLAPGFVVTSFTVDGESRSVRRNGSSWNIDLGADGKHTASIAYSGLLPRLTENSDASGGLSEGGGYLGPATGWYPDVGNIAFSYDLSVRVPSPQIAVAPGRMVNEVRGDDSYHVRLASERLSGGIVLMTGPWRIDEKQHGKIRIRTYFIDDLTPFSKGYLDSTAEYLSLYEGRIGDYPFSAFSIVSGPLPVGLGFAGLTYIGERVLRLPFIRTTSLGHEVLHSWWGNGVEIDYATGNWAEGLTTYMADYAFAEARGPEHALNMRIGWLRDYTALPATREKPVKDFTSRRHNAEQVIGYNKVAFIFHMLKNELGSADFDQGLRHFWNKHKFATAGWEDLRRSFEAVSQCDLRIFFKQWVGRTGAPELILEDAMTTPTGVSFTVAQKGSPYLMELPVTLTTDGGDKKYPVRISTRQDSINTASAQPVRGLSLDPGFDLFRRLSPGEAPPILRDTTFATDTVTVLATNDDAMRRTALQLAGRMLGERPDLNDTGTATALLVIGSTRQVGDFLKARNLPPAPENIISAGTARAWAGIWTDQHGTRRPLLVVEADDLTALELLLRPLPHYGRKGYLIFEGSKVIDQGLWPARKGPLSIRFK